MKPKRKQRIAYYACIEDGGDFGRLLPVYKKQRRARKKGDPLIQYPAGQRPVYTGLMPYN